MSNGLQAQVSYTLSKSVDDGASALGGNDFTNEGARRPLPLSKGPRAVAVRRQACAGGQRELRRCRSARRPPALAALLDQGLDRRHADPLSQRLSVLGVLGRGHRPAGPGLGAGIPGSRAGASANPVLGTVDHWFDPSAFVLPATGFIGTLAAQLDHRSGHAHGRPDRPARPSASADRASCSCGSNASTC